MSILTCILGVPLLAAVLLAIVPRNFRVIQRAGAVFATGLSAVLAVVMYCQFDPAVSEYQFVQTLTWVESLGISYSVGVDGINVALVLMAAIVAFAAACVSWDIQDREKEFYILLLVMAGGVIGAFASLDLFFLYIFHEFALVPTFIMIGVWGRGEQKNYATFQITLYLGIGSLLALIGLLGLCIYSGANTFSIPELTEYFSRPDQQIAAGVQAWLFPLLLFGFGILVSLWPFHSWAPMGYASAPTATAMMHAGVLKKFGLYALIRVAVPMLPVGAQDWMPILAWLCLGNLLYCGWVAMRQKDLNWLVGYSSVAHMGFVLLGIATLNVIGLTGAVLVMVAHGFLAALTFALSGYVYRQTGTLEMAQLGGLLRRMPFIGVLLLMAAFAGCGLPGFANFAGEVTVFFGAWTVYPAVTIIACWGALVVGAVYFLRAVRSVLHGPAERWAQVVDAASLWRKMPFALLLACLLLFGFYPRLLTRHIEVGAAKILESVQPAVGQVTPGVSNSQITFKN